MRVLLGLAVFAAGASAQTVMTSLVAGGTVGTSAQIDTGAPVVTGPNLIAVTTGAPAGLGSSIAANANYISFGSIAVNGFNGYVQPASGGGAGSPIGSTDRVSTPTYQNGVVNGGTTTVYVQMNFNALVNSVQYQLTNGYTILTSACDPCSAAACTFGAGPTDNTGTCANLKGRVFTVTLPTGLNQFKVNFYDYIAGQPSNFVTYSFAINRPAVVLVGDPQIVGMQGQDFQVHGMPDEIFNMVTYPNVQVNARFTYLSEAECPDNYTTCFAHPGTYISEQGLRVGRDKVRVVAGPAKAGLTVHVNGKKVHQKITHLKLGSVEIVNHRRVVVKTPIAALTMTNSDKFMNQEINMFDDKLIALGAKRHVLKAGQSFHPEVPLHGLQGQTWRNVEYPSGLEYEGSIMDYHVVDGNLFGSDFVFNKFAL